MHVVDIVAEFDERLRPTLLLLLCEPLPRIRWTGVTLDTYMVVVLCCVALRFEYLRQSR